MSIKELPRKGQLGYSIHRVSSTSNTSINYKAENILEDNPNDPCSRWSSDTNSPPQFLVLKLDSPSVVSSITFGKFEKNHVCNLKRFKVFGGYDEENMLELLDSGLKNDTSKETFRLRHSIQGHFFPCQFIKIVPLLSWGPSFNFSIWHVALHGDHSKETVGPAILRHNEFREREAIRLCLKHFRQYNYNEAFECLQKKTKIQLEDPQLTELYKILVRDGDYVKTEKTIYSAITDGLFDKWIDSQTPVPSWTALIPPDDLALREVSGVQQQNPQNPNSNQMSPEEPGEHQNPNLDFLSPTSPPDLSSDSSCPPPPLMSSLSAQDASMSSISSLPTLPGCRGGHQMCIDIANQTIFLFGGWDGHQDLGDFWKYHIPTEKWTLISINTEFDGGPSPRSCHKMVLDSTCGHIFVLGRYLERIFRDNLNQTKSDFFMYDINANRWTLITDDTSAMGGPNLIFDHQMCIDQTTRTIYVFGGQTLLPNSDENRLLSERRYSGLYEYQIPTNTWKKRKDEGNYVGASNEIRSRASHSMLFHQGLRKLFIFGGQRKRSNTRDETLNDFFSYSVDTDEMEIISTGATSDSAVPAVGHTQRATIDFERNEIHVMTGLNKDKERGEKSTADRKLPIVPESKVTNSFWVYSIAQNNWNCFYRNDNEKNESWQQKEKQEPRPRYAHQLVYDELNKIHFMFGGNPGGKQGKEDRMRLGDFWSLKLYRPPRCEVMRKTRLNIRHCHFSELALTNKIRALEFLQKELSSIVNHDDTTEEAEFQLLASKLFQGDSSESSTSSSSSFSSSPPSSTFKKADPVHVLRNALFEVLSGYFPEDMTHPRNNLIDLVTFPMELS